jgi:glycosyltransferase involved in cell wall biosynthesis
MLWSFNDIDPLGTARSPLLGEGGRRDGSVVISVVLSFFNEAEVLPELVRRLRAMFDGLRDAHQIGGYELIFVNDASTDRSEEVLRQEIELRGDIRLINMSRNFGVSPCVLAGMRHARGEAIVYMDADLQDPPEVIPELVRAWQAEPNVEVVHTVRRSRAGESRLKLALTRVGYAVLRGMSAINLPVEAGDFKLLSRRAADLLLQLGEQRPFMRGLVCWIGFEQRQVYYDRQPRWSGKTKFHVLGPKVIGSFLNSAVISFSDAPLKLATGCGLLFLMAASLAMLALLAGWLRGGDVPGWSATLAAVVFVGGVQLLCTGILGTYLGSIYWQSKARPNYIVRECVGGEKGPWRGGVAMRPAAMAPADHDHRALASSE